MTITSNESTYVGLGLRVDRAGRFPPTFEFGSAFVCFSDGKIDGAACSTGKAGDGGLETGFDGDG